MEAKYKTLSGGSRLLHGAVWRRLHRYARTQTFKMADYCTNEELDLNSARCVFL